MAVKVQRPDLLFDVALDIHVLRLGVRKPEHLDQRQTAVLCRTRPKILARDISEGGMIPTMDLCCCSRSVFVSFSCRYKIAVDQFLA